jgi:hypothetical protein
LTASILLVAPSAGATWSIVMADAETREVAVCTVTCLTGFDMLDDVPVVVVGTGAAAVQSFRDPDGSRKVLIFEQLMLGTPPEDILVLLSAIDGHEMRQYGIADTNGATMTFSGAENGQWAGGVTGTDGTMVYAIQGNVLAGACVVSSIEAAVLSTDGDMAQKLMAGMQAARQAGGDGRCSCATFNPTICGCPPGIKFDKSGHIGSMQLARVGDTDDPSCDAFGCADGDYFMTLNVANQSVGDPDPVEQLQGLFDAWRLGLVGRPDAVQSVVGFDPEVVQPNGVSTTRMEIALLDWQGLLISVAIQSLTVQHAATSDGLSTIGPVVDEGGGVYSVVLTSGTTTGVDRFVVTADDGIRPVILSPEPWLEYFPLGDIDGDGIVGIQDFLTLLANWGPCPMPCPPTCAGDIDGDCQVGINDFLSVLANWTS